MQKNNKIGLILSVLLVTSFAITGCTSSSAHAYSLAPAEDLPVAIQQGPDVVRTAYQFAVANPDILTQLPCYCGCGGMGHTSNYSCYVAAENADGSLTFENHAAGCSICVDITMDAMRMLDEGQSMSQIRTTIDQTYSAFGPSNMP